MTNRITAIMIGAEAIGAATAPLEIPSSWAPALFTPPPLPVPSEIVVSPVGDGAAIQFKLPTKGMLTVVETAPNVSGAPGAWKLLAQTSGIGVTVPLVAGEQKWVRLRNVKNGRSSAYTTAQLVSGIRTPQNLDGLADGATFARVRSSVLTFGVVRGVAAGANMVANPNFATSANTVVGAVVTSAGPICDNWRVAFDVAGYWQAIYESAGVVLLRFRDDATLPANPAFTPGVAVYGDTFDVEPGRSYRVQVSGSASNTTSPPSGFTFLHRIVLFWYTQAGVYISASVSDQNTYGSANRDLLLTAPTGAYRAIPSLWGYVGNSSASPIAAAGQRYADLRFTSITVKLAADMDAEVAHGSTYGRIANSDLVDSGGVRRLGLRVAGSGHRPADQRNQHPVTVGSVRSRWDGQAITYSVPTTGSPATVTINASAATLRLGSASVSYNAAGSSVSQARGTSQTYQLYYIDGAYAGGSRTLNITTTTNDLANSDQVVWVGEVVVTVPALGTSGSGSGSPGGGAGGILP